MSIDAREMVQQSNFDHPSDEIDLREIFSAIWAGKWIVITITSIFSIASVVYVLSLPNRYKSTVVLAPVETSGGGLGKLASQFGGLASLTGVTLQGGGSSKKAEALEILQSWAFIEEFIQEQNIAPEVFAVKGWRSKTNELIYDTSIYDPQSQTWTRETREGEQAEPSSWQLFQKFNEYVSVDEDKETGFTALNIEYYSPEIAKAWVDALVYKINIKLQTRDSKEAEKNIAFLKQQIEQTQLASMQSVFYGLIEEQTKTLMLAKGSAEYVFKTVSESRIPERKSNPKRAFICVAFSLLGMLLSVCYVIARLRFRS